MAGGNNPEPEPKEKQNLDLIKEESKDELLRDNPSNQR
jgi:hypothetical protein